MSFDTLTYAKKLQEAGVPSQQAEVQADALRMLVEEKLATKQDLKELEAGLEYKIELVRRDIKEMEAGLRHDMKEMEAGLRHDMKEMESRIVLRLGALVVAAVTVLGVVLGVLMKVP